ncbi:hypothetical protein JL475_00565 [Streptomyces sp. M2CJ-2]|uniref:hypothetical protein n=1 Tax=Streptomyces sp. M2CJ-2 TaxID=2803948 RepID=UPI0019225BCC|nr:hypothetical protein [Streptomyces sp. M2CJ-2]MBL3664539.1 hypothetical protein [Streptomyces sp. M2CJ-2]
MAEFSAPFDGSPINTQIQWSRMARRWGLDGVHALDASSTALKVTGSGTTTVTVAAGHAFVNGFYYHNDAAKNLTVPANAGGAARIDLVILRADQAAKTVTAVYKAGGTSAPTLTQSETGVWEIPLAQCTVAAGASVVTAANVLDRRWLTDRGVLPSIAGARPPAAKGQLLLEDGKLYVGDGAAWRWMATQGVDDSTYTPVWTAGNSTVNWGSGSVNVGRYQARGKRVDVTIQLEPTGNPPAYPDPLEVSLPPGLPATLAHRSLFTWNFSSMNGEGTAIGIGMVFPTTSRARIARLRYSMTNGTTSSSMPNSFSMLTNQPHNIRNGDVLTIDGSYWTD